MTLLKTAPMTAGLAMLWCRPDETRGFSFAAFAAMRAVGKP